MLYRVPSSYQTQSPLHCLLSHSLVSRLSLHLCVPLYILLQFAAYLCCQRTSFCLYDNPFCKEITEQLKTGVKQMMDFLKTEE